MTRNRTGIETQVAALESSLERFTAWVRTLDAPDFLRPIGRWTTRDIVAHLIGWNRYSVRGSRQLLKGEPPFYDDDPGEDYCNVNARLVAEYPTEDRTELLDELARAATELADYLRSLSASEWRGGTGVELDGEELTIRQNVDWLIEDHSHHSAQIRELTQR